jgi:hypothetical protein
MQAPDRIDKGAFGCAVAGGVAPASCQSGQPRQALDLTALRDRHEPGLR